MLVQIVIVATLAIYFHSLVSDWRILVLAVEDEGYPLCTSKLQMGLDKPALLRTHLEPIQFIDFDEMPFETMLVNDGHLVYIRLLFNDTVPSIKVNFDKSLGFKGTYRLDSLYFHWFEEVAPELVYENITFPAEFMAYFYNKKFPNLEHASMIDTGTVILSFAVQISPSASHHFDVLHGNLKHIREYYTDFTIPNRNLRYWLPFEMKQFYLHQGAYRYYCTGKVAYVDFTDILRISPDIVKEFQELEGRDMHPLMTDVIDAIKPSGQVYTNVPNGNGPTTNHASEVLLAIVGLFLIFY